MKKKWYAIPRLDEGDMAKTSLSTPNSDLLPCILPTTRKMAPLPSYGMMPTTRKMAMMALQNEPYLHHNEPHTNLNKAKKKTD